MQSSFGPTLQADQHEQKSVIKPPFRVFQLPTGKLNMMPYYNLRVNFFSTKVTFKLKNTVWWSPKKKVQVDKLKKPTFVILIELFYFKVLSYLIPF